MKSRFRRRSAIACLIFMVMTLAVSNHASAQEVEDGFTSLFNGKDLAGWFCDEQFWRVQDGVIIGQTDEDHPAPHNTFLIRRGEEYGDFELRFSYQVQGYNSGVQYRSVEQDDYVVKGYQADFEDRWHEGGKDRFTGMFFEENGRMFLGKRGEVVRTRVAAEDGKAVASELIASLGDPDELEATIRRGDWNDYVVIAKGFHFTHIINGRAFSMAWDEDEKNRRASGIFAFQLHSGPPMQIKIKGIRVRRL